jgi:hypothetical protein
LSGQAQMSAPHIAIFICSTIPSLENMVLSRLGQLAKAGVVRISTHNIDPTTPIQEIEKLSPVRFQTTSRDSSESKNIFFSFFSEPQNCRRCLLADPRYAVPLLNALESCETCPIEWMQSTWAGVESIISLPVFTDKRMTLTRVGGTFFIDIRSAEFPNPPKLT